MYTIGEFAALGRVSARMLRHYDAVGLLPPAVVDERSGYRHYAIGQLPKLLQIAQLRDLGVGLDAIADAFAGGDAALERALVARRLELEASVAGDTARLHRLERRLSLLRGKAMSAVQYRPVEEVTVYATSTVAEGAGPENVSPAIAAAMPSFDAALRTAGRPLIEPGIFWYEPVGEAMTVHISFTAEDDPVPGEGYEVVTLPAVPTMATLLHRGDMTGIGASWSELMDRLVADGYRVIGACREVYLDAPGYEPGPEWVTELQAPVEKA